MSSITKWGGKHQIRRKYDTLQYIIAYNGLSFILGKSVTLHLKPEKKGITIMLRSVVCRESIFIPMNFTFKYFSICVKKEPEAI